ncbi:MAG: c-type cytochrome domain-containing protein [Planctomyces sp.]
MAGPPTMIAKTPARPQQRQTLILTLVVLAATATLPASAAEPWEMFLTTYCVRCHGEQKVEGDLRIDTLSRDFRSGVDTHHWAETLDKVNSGQMPPRDQPSPLRTKFRPSSLPSMACCRTVAPLAWLPDRPCPITASVAKSIRIPSTTCWESATTPPVPAN